MASVLRMFPLVMVVVISTELTSAQQSKEVTITEPGIYELAGLFKQADTVALVKVVSGDTEAYDIAVYKAEVVKKLQRCGNGRDPLLRPLRGRKTRMGVHSVSA